MKAFILSSTLSLACLVLNAQDNQVNTLPAGKYEMFTGNNQGKWDMGDIILLPENKYKISTSDEVGEYKFSVTAQRVFFTSGPLKSLYAKTSMNKDVPAIVLPVSENAQFAHKIPSDILGVLKQ